jgi:hypothetical protein
MQIGDTKSLKKALIALFIVAAVLQLADFGSYYVGRYGFSLAPFVHGQDGLRWIFYHDAVRSMAAGMITAVMVYLGARRKRDESKSKDAVKGSSPES